MRSKVNRIFLVLVLGATSSALAEPASTDDRHPADAGGVAAVASIDIPDEAQAAVDLVDAFGEALGSADFDQVKAMLDSNVIVLEGGRVESSRSEYLDHHARSDAKFLSGAEMTLLQRRARIEGSTAWVASESEIHARDDGKPLVLLSTETMVLSNTPSGWKIVHIHWSSRPKPTSASGADATPTTE